MFLFELLRLCLVLLIRETHYNFKSLHKKIISVNTFRTNLNRFLGVKRYKNRF